ncbi:MAG: glycoside hydrolase family 16 protein [Clostridia bacterium]|nr:glycoside hydrolase family 16 protein [Clostridia bacterium]
MMTKLISILVSILMFFSPELPAFLDLPAIAKGQALNLDERFELVWEDEFTGTELDKTKWDDNQSVDTLHWGPIRKGGYWHKDMIDVRDGNLVISTEYKSTPLEGPTFGSPDTYGEGYYTGMIATAGKHEFKYGYFECRAILPKATGMWSAFWMMNGGVYEVNNSGEDGTEIDVFESMFYKDAWWGAGDCVQTGIHYDGYGEGHTGVGLGKYFANNPYEEYNTYGVEWNENEYIFYINGIETARTSAGGVSKNPEYLILSCEVAGENGIAYADRHGVGPIDIEPGERADFIVDYVRVYQYK